MGKIPEEKTKILEKDLPAAAISQHPTKPYLSSIKSIFITERLNEVFWVGGWQIRVRKESEDAKGMVIVHTTFEVPEYEIHYEVIAGNDNGWATSKNFDLGDAYKGAITDWIGKIASWLGIGAHVYKNEKPGNKTPPKKDPPPPKTPPAPPKEPTIVKKVTNDKWLTFDDYIQSIRMEDDTSHIATLYRECFDTIIMSEKQLVWLKSEARQQTDKIENQPPEFDPENSIDIE